MSPNRIEGTCYAVQVAQAPKYDWFVVKHGTAKSDSKTFNVKSDITISNVKLAIQLNEFVSSEIFKGLLQERIIGVKNKAMKQG